MKKLFKTGTLFLGAAFVSCESRTYGDISKKEDPPALVTYTQNIKPLIDNHCTICHSANGAAAFFPLTDHTLVKNAIDNILNRIQRPNGDPQKMPQGGSLSPAQIDLLKKWKADGLQ